MSTKPFTAISILTIFWNGILQVNAKFQAAYVIPHGSLALDPAYFHTTNTTSLEQAWAIHNACESIGKQIGQLSPDLIVLSTPHGFRDWKNFVLYMTPTAEGTFKVGRCKCPDCCYRVKVKVNVKISRDIISRLGSIHNISGLYANEESFPLRWGEIIPLHYIGRKLRRIPVVIISNPARGSQVSMIPGLLKLGEDLSSYLDQLQEKVVVIISADLAHTHLPDGRFGYSDTAEPFDQVEQYMVILPDGPYGYSDTSEPFDQALGQWASWLDERSLLYTAAMLADRALSCGYTGIVMLHGMLVAKGLLSWQPDLLVNHHPSYYGMMVASFTQKHIT